MRKTFFIADLHLDDSHTQSVAMFERFIARLHHEHQAPITQIDGLYILGDLFEYWLGDDCLSHTAQRVADRLSQLNQAGIPIYFQHGNRDFLLKQSYADRCQMQLLPEHAVINLYGQSTLIAHGDTLCTDDVAYQNFRAKTRTAQWQHRILSLPRWVRKAQARYYRIRSQMANRHKVRSMMDVNKQTVLTAMKTHQVNTLIHGHTHRPDLHEYPSNGKPYRRYVLGDWENTPTVVEATPSAIQLLTLDEITQTQYIN